MKTKSTLLLKIVIICIGLVIGIICLVVLPKIIMLEMKTDFDYLPLFVGLYVPAIPFYLALYKSFLLLEYIENNNAFSNASVRAFGYIKFCAVAISLLFILGLPYIFHLADQDDAPGLVAVTFIIIFASVVIATFSAVLQKLVQNAVTLQSENDLTV